MNAEKRVEPSSTRANAYSNRFTGLFDKSYETCKIISYT